MDGNDHGHKHVHKPQLYAQIRSLSRLSTRLAFEFRPVVHVEIFKREIYFI